MTAPVHSASDALSATHPDESMTLGEEIRRQLRAAPWYLTSAAVHMTLLLLLLLIPPHRPEREERILLTTDFRQDEPLQRKPEPDLEPLIPEKVNKTVAETIEKVSPNDPSDAPVVETRIDPAVEVESEPVSIAPSEVTADADVDEVLAPSSEAAAVPMGVGARLAARRGGAISGCRGGPGDLGERIRAVATSGSGAEPGYGRGLLLVWLLDQSASMQDDQVEVAAHVRDIQEMLTDGGRREVVSAVARYGKAWALMQEPTREAARVAEAMRTVPTDPTGRENACGAIRWLADALLGRYRGWTKVVVVLTDENTSDGDAFVRTGGGRSLPNLDAALRRLVETKTRLLVVGKEAPFQFDKVREWHEQADGAGGWFFASRGPESARIEAPVYISQNFENAGRGEYRGDEVKSGFGVYDLAYLAARSKGAYFILDPQAGDRRPLSRSERMRNPFRIDWGVMDLYKPDMVSRLVYEETLAKTRYGGALVRLNRILRARRHATVRRSRCRPVSRYAENRDALRRRSEMLDRLIEVIGPERADAEALETSERRRHIANIDLYYCLLLADRIITEAWLDAYEAYDGPVEVAPEKGYWTELALRPVAGGALDEDRKALFDARMAELVRACNGVIRRHANTPWAVCARWIRRGPEKWGRPHELVLVKHKHGAGGGGGGTRPDIGGI